MGYKTLVKLDGGLHKRGDDLFLEQEKLKQLAESGSQLKPYNLLYFLKKQSFDVWADFPVCGASEAVLTHSSVEGPFVEKPNVQETCMKYGCIEYCEGVIKKIFPVSQVPAQDSFKKIELRSYGTRIDDTFTTFLRVFKDDLKIHELERVKQFSYEKLKELSSELKEDNHTCTALVDSCLVELFSSDVNFYPLVNARILGPEKKTSKIVEQLELHGLTNVFDSSILLVGLENLIQEGVAHNFSVKDFGSIRQAKESENVIL